LDSPIHLAHVITDNIPTWGGIFLTDARGDMKFPAMPGTGDVFSFYGSFSQGATGVGAGVIECKDATIQVKEGNAPILGLNAFAGARWEIFNLGDRDEM